YSTRITSTVPAVDLGPDLVLCQGDTPNKLNAGGGGASYFWTINGVHSPEDTEIEQEIDTSTPGEYLYEVVKTSPLGCVVMDEVNVVINGRPNFTATPFPTSSCGTGDGSISLTNNDAGAEANFSFLWSNGETTEDIADLSAGLYNVAITDETTGCVQEINNIAVEDGNAGFNITVDPNPTNASCGAADGSVFILIDNPAVAFSVAWTIYDATGNFYRENLNQAAHPTAPNSFEVTD